MILVNQKNLLKIDPTRTTMIRRQFVADMARRFKRVSKAIWKLVTQEDVFGLSPRILVMQEMQAWRFHTDAKKITSYRDWLQTQVNSNVLQVDFKGDPWTSEYVESSYKKGVQRAYLDVNKMRPDFYEGTQSQFLQEAFNAPETLNKLELLYTRTFEELRGVSSAMSQQMSRTLALGIAEGRGPVAIARQLTKDVQNITKRRALVIARTEIIHAHAEGQLDSFDKLGVEEIGVMAEISTAGDDRVCEECSGLEGETFTIDQARGMIPIHPNCRCAWVPTEEKKKLQGELEYRLPTTLPDTPEMTSLLATEKDLVLQTKSLRKAYKAGNKTVRPALMKTKKELQLVHDKIDSLAKGVKPAPTPTPAPAPAPAPTPAPTPTLVKIPEVKPPVGNGPIRLDTYSSMSQKKAMEISTELRNLYPDKLTTFNFAETEGAVFTSGSSTQRVLAIVNNQIVGAISHGIDDMTNLISIRHLGVINAPKGTGSELIRTAVERAYKNKTGIILESTKEAEGFYLRLGFVRNKKISKIFEADFARVKEIRKALGPIGRYTPTKIPKLSTVKPTKVPGVGATKFETAEDYRQHIIEQVDALKTAKAENLIKELTKKSEEAYTAYRKSFKIADDNVQKEALANLKITEAALKKAKDAAKLSIEAQRKLLNETDNMVSKVELIADKAIKKNVQSVADDILNWVPKTREVSGLSIGRFNEVIISSFGKKSSNGLFGSYNPMRAQISLYTNSKQVFAHEFGHHMAYKLKGFMSAETRLFRARTIGEKVTNLVGSIKGKKDKWANLDVYAGRIYADVRAHEVASVGIEHLWANPYLVAKKDPEWFNMIVSQLKGIPVK